MRKKSLSAIGLSILGALLVVLVVVTVAAGFQGEVNGIPIQTRLRVAHLAPFTDTLPATGVDVKLDGTQILTDFQYLSSTTYLPTTAGDHLVQVFPTGDSTPVISATVNLTDGMDYSAFAIGGANGYALTLKPEVDDNDPPAMGNGKVRFGHLAPFAPVPADTAAEIRTDDGALVAGPFLYGEIDSVYAELPADTYDLKVVTAADGQTLINLAPFPLSGGDILYALAVGDGTNQDPGVFAYPTDEEGFLLKTEEDPPELRVAHLAPFADTLEGTAVDVKIDGMQILTDFQYLSSTTYLETTAGEHQVQVFPSGSMTPAISATVDLESNVDYSAFAIGGANGYSLTLKAEVDNNNAPVSGTGKVRFGHLAPFDPVPAKTAAEIRTDSGTLVAGPFLYEEIDNAYIELPAGTYDLWVTGAGGGPVFINLAPFTLNDGDILYALAVGDGSNQELNVFAYPTDVEGFLLPKEDLFKTYFPIVFKQ